MYQSSLRMAHLDPNRVTPRPTRSVRSEWTFLLEPGAKPLIGPWEKVTDERAARNAFLGGGGDILDSVVFSKEILRQSGNRRTLGSSRSLVTLFWSFPQTWAFCVRLTCRAGFSPTDNRFYLNTRSHCLSRRGAPPAVKNRCVNICVPGWSCPCCWSRMQGGNVRR